MGFWLSSDKSHIMLLTYGLIGSIGAAYCDWCPYYCNGCCNGLIPSFCGDGTDDGVGGGIGAPNLTFTAVLNGGDPVSGYVVNGTLGGASSGPCSWIGSFTVPDLANPIIDSLYQDRANGCRWSLIGRFFDVGEFTTITYPLMSDSSACSGTFTFTFTSDGGTNSWVLTFTIPTPMMMGAAPAIPDLPAPSPAIERGMRAFVGAQPKRTTLLAENQRRAKLGLSPVKAKPCGGCGKKKKLDARGSTSDNLPSRSNPEEGT